MLNKRRNKEPSVETWKEMKRVMHKRFVLTHYYRELYNNLQNLRQGNRGVESIIRRWRLQWLE